MEIIVGVFLYILVVALFIAYGKFLKESDDAMSEGMRHEDGKRSRRQFPVQNQF